MINPNSFSWTGATEREDGTPYLPEDRRGYNVYIVSEGSAVGAADLTFTAISSVNNFSIPVADLGNPLTEGNWELYVTDVDIDGRESGYSVPLAFSVVIAAPKSPTGLGAS